MFTISQLLESVDLDFEPRFVTQDADSSIWMWREKPRTYQKNLIWNSIDENREPQGISISNNIKLSEFDGKDWTECIYEVPRKTTGKIEKLGKLNVSGTNMTMNQNTVNTIVNSLNQVIDAVNELKGE